MSAGGSLPSSPGLTAVLVSCDADVPFTTRAAAREALEENDFDVVEVVLDSSGELLPFLSEQIEDARICVILGGLSCGPDPDVADDLRSLLVSPLPGVVDLLRTVQIETGYSRAVFEYPAAGWVGECLTATLPGDRDAVSESLDELLSHFLDIADSEDVAAAGFEAHLPGAKTATSLPDATILHMPRPTDPPEDPLV